MTDKGEIALKKRIVKGICLGILTGILVTMPAFGGTGNQVRVPEGEYRQQTLVQIYDRRGNWVADGLLSISNPRNGKIGIYISTMCHVPVDEIEMSVAVDQDKGDWEQVDYLTYHFYPEAGEDGIEEASVDYELPGHEANQYYRLRGLHTVYMGNSSESLDSETGGMLITDH